MADVLQTQALIVLAQNYGGNIVRQINRKVSALRVIPITLGEGANVAWVAEKSGALAAAYSEGADATDFGSDGQAAAILNWSQMRSTMHVSGLAEATAGTSATPEGNIMLLRRNMINGAAALAALANLYVFSGNGAASPKQPTGLDAAIGSISNTYATIDRSVGGNAFWRPTVADPGTLTALTLAQVRSDLKNIFIACGEKADVGLCSPSVFQALGQLFDDQRRYVSDVNTARGVVKLNAGFSGIEIDGCVFVQDKDATESQIYYINTNHIELQVLPSPSQRPREMVAGEMFQANDGFGDVPLSMRFEPLAKNGDSERMQIKLYCELMVRRPNAFGVRKNVAIS